MRPRLYADLLGFLRAACTHASHAGRELPVLPFYVREHVVGWLRPSFADMLRRWPHVFEVKGQRIAVLGATQVLDGQFVDAWTAQGDEPGMASAKRVDRVGLG